MTMQQNSVVAFPISVRASAALADLWSAVKRISNRDISVGGLNSGLDPHLQYDIGETDFDPGRTRLCDSQRPYELQVLMHQHPW